MTAQVDTQELESKVKQIYREVALRPDGAFHFGLGHELAVRLGYDVDRLSRIPVEAVRSFAGVGHFFDLAHLKPGEVVVDLGSGSGMDVFYAALLVGPAGRVVGVDFTTEQLDKARSLGAAYGWDHVEFLEGHVESLPVESGSADCVISNGVINLCPDKTTVFTEAARILRPGGRMAIADLVTERQLGEDVTCNADLWASCIAGATQREAYLHLIGSAGFAIEQLRANDYEFVSDRARSAGKTYGVTSISLRATMGRHSAGG